MWVRQASRSATRFRHALRSSFTDSKRYMQQPLSMSRVCCTSMNILLAPVAAGVMLRRILRRCLHIRKYQECDLGGIAASDALTLASWGYGRRRRWWQVSKSHPKITLRVDQAESPCLSFF